MRGSAFSKLEEDTVIKKLTASRMQQLVGIGLGQACEVKVPTGHDRHTFEGPLKAVVKKRHELLGSRLADMTSLQWIL